MYSKKKSNAQVVARRIWLTLLRPLKLLFWFITRPRVKAVLVLIENNNEFLLVRQNFSHKKWRVPGGVLEQGETFESGAHREMEEELGVKLYNLKNMGAFNFKSEKRSVDARLVHATIPTRELTIEQVEIAEVGWFSLKTIPEQNVGARRVIEYYLSKK